MTADTPRVWVGCLDCYNAGDLVGAWFDAADCPTEMDEWERHDVQGVTPPTFGVPFDHVAEAHEELWVMDHESFRGFLTDECSPSEARALAERMAELEDDGDDLDAIAAYCWLNSVNLIDLDVDDFRDAYQGEYDSDEDFAQQLADDLDLINADAGWPNSYIDWERAARDLMMDYSAHDGHYFRNT